MMRRETVGQALILALVAVAVVAGLAVTGGPERGRIERRDAQRVQDIYELSNLTQCLAAAQTNSLPETLARSDLCPGDPLPEDPSTGAAYSYARLGATSYRICAAFERPGDLGAPFRGVAQFDSDTGCAVFAFKP